MTAHLVERWPKFHSFCSFTQSQLTFQTNLLSAVSSAIKRVSQDSSTFAYTLNYSTTRVGPSQRLHVRFKAYTCPNGELHWSSIRTYRRIIHTFYPGNGAYGASRLNHPQLPAHSCDTHLSHVRSLFLDIHKISTQVSKET